MTLIDFNKKELRDIYSSLQYTRLEIGFESKSEEELYDRLTKLMDKVYLRYDSNPKTTESHADM